MSRETLGSENGAEFDGDAMHLLNFPNLDTNLQGGDYYVRLEWPNREWMQFHIPTGSDIFDQTAENKYMEIDQVLSSTDDVVFGEQAYFCHACIVGGPQYGDTCWGVTPLTDHERACGCNSGGWAGEGIYYGGYKDQTVCGGQGGGFSGAAENHEPKGNLPSVGLILSIRTRCLANEFFNATLNRCRPYSVCTYHEFESVRPTWASDRVCIPCADGADPDCLHHLVGLWSFDNGAIDSISATVGQFEGLANPGVHGTMDTVSDGDGGNALVVRGDVRLNTHRWLPSGAKTVTFSIAAAEFTNAAPTTWLNQTGDNMFAVGVANGRLFIDAGSTRIPATLPLWDVRPNTGSCTPSCYHPFAVVDDGEGTLTIWEDGHQIGGIEYEGETGTSLDPASTFMIGGGGSYNIGKVQIFNRALTDAQILLEAGATASYNHPAESSEWELVFRHDTSGSSFWPHPAQPTRTINRDSSHPETEAQFARLDELESLRSHDGYLTFKMVWPRICQQSVCAAHENNYIIWRQRSNPNVAPADDSTAHVDGFEALTLGYWSRGSAPDTAFGGLEYNNEQCLFDGNVNHHHWYFTIGAYARWGPGTNPTFPGPRRADTGEDVAVDLVELYAFNYTAELGMSGDGSNCPTQSYAKLGRACCRNEDGVDGPVRTVAAIDVPHCRQACDDEGEECQGFEFRPSLARHECELHFSAIHHVEFNGGGITCSCYIRAPPAPGTSPRVFYNETGQKCQDIRSCLPTLEFEAAPPTASTDRACTSCHPDCGDGSYLAGSCESRAGPQCTSCPAGSYCGNGTAVRCPNNFWSSAGRTTCTHCASVGSGSSRGCVYGPGDGRGGTEERIGNALSEDECAVLVQTQRPTANGATFGTGDRAGQCYAEFGARSISGSTVWRSCIFSEYETGLCVGVSGGVYTDATGTSMVQRTCPCGSYCPDRATERFPCPANTSTNLPGQASCAECPYNSYSASNASSCLSVVDGREVEVQSIVFCGGAGLGPPPTMDPTAPVTQPPTAMASVFPVMLTVYADIGSYANIHTKGSWGWDTPPQVMQAVTSSRWTAEKRLAPGTYEWGAVYGGGFTWLLDQPLTYCGSDPSNPQHGGNCGFTVSGAGVITGLTTIHAAAPTTTPGRTTRPPPTAIPACSAFGDDRAACITNRCFYASGACSETRPPTPPLATSAAATAGARQQDTTTTASVNRGPDAAELIDQSKEGAGVGMIVGIVIVAVVTAVTGVVWYFKRKMAGATVVIEKDEVTGEMVGTVSFVNSSYEPTLVPANGSGYAKVGDGDGDGDDDDEMLIGD